MLAEGDTYPSFEMVDEEGASVSSSELGGKWFLLYWYPRADTPGCTAQAQGLRDQIEAFDELTCTVLGASLDEPADNRAFRMKYGLPFRLLSDQDQDLATSLGVINEESAGGYPRRIAHLVNPSGVIQKRYVVEDPEFFAEKVLDDLEEALSD